MYRLTPLSLFIVVCIGSTLGVSAQVESKRSIEQICQARADETEISSDVRETFMRECLAGERLVRSKAERK